MPKHSSGEGGGGRGGFLGTSQELHRYELVLILKFWKNVYGNIPCEFRLALRNYMRDLCSQGNGNMP